MKDEAEGIVKRGGVMPRMAHYVCPLCRHPWSKPVGSDYVDTADQFLQTGTQEEVCSECIKNMAATSTQENKKTASE